MPKTTSFVAAVSILASAALGPSVAYADVKIGFIATLSSPAGYIGEDEPDAFKLVVDEEGGKLGGVPIELVVEDDALKPTSAKQAADRMIQSGKSLFTGINSRTCSPRSCQA